MPLGYLQVEFEADAENVRAAIEAAGSISDPRSILFTNVSEFSLGRRRLLAMGVIYLLSIKKTTRLL